MLKKQQTKVLDMTEGSVLRLLLRYSVPIFFGRLLQQFYNLADTALAGNILGDTALAEIGATSALYSMLTAFAFGLNIGFALLVSSAFGAGDETRVRQSAGWMSCLSVSLSLLIALCTLVFRRPLLTLLQVPSEVYGGALSYITVIFAGFPLVMLYNMESGLLNAVGNSTTPLWFLLFSSLLNIGLDILFMGPLHFGVTGAAAATVLAQGVSAVLCFFYLLRNYPQFHFSREDLSRSKSIAPEMLKTGFNMGLMEAIFSIGSVILQRAINGLGSVYIAAQTSGRKLEELFMMPGSAIATSIATFSSQNYGAGKRRRIAKGCLTGIGMYLVWWGFAMLYLFTLADASVKLITGSSDQEVIASALLYLRVNIPMYPPMGALIMIRNTLQGMRHQIPPLIGSCIELLVKIIFAFWIVPVTGYMAVCVCEPVSWVICFLYILAAVFFCRKEFTDAAEARSL